MRFAFPYNRKDVKPRFLVLDTFLGDISVFCPFYATINQVRQAGEKLNSIHKGALSACQNRTFLSGRKI